MRISQVVVDVVGIRRANIIIVRLETDAGLTGLGETVVKRRDFTVQKNIQEMAGYLVGLDPLAIEDHAEKLYRDSFWIGGGLHGAGRSAVDVALWDLKGQSLNAPVYQLLGGPTRDRIPVYAHCPAGSSPEEFAANLITVRDRGYWAAKTTLPIFYGSGGKPDVTGAGYSGTQGHLGPSLKETEYLPTAAIARIAKFFEVARQTVGPDFELMLDCHGRLAFANALRLTRALEEFGLLFIEEPIPPESATDLARLQKRSHIPIAAGERLSSVYDVRPFLEQGSVDILQCDVVNCGGITAAKKIAAMAEAYCIPMAPHNPNGPIAMAAATHLLAAIPNAMILESVGSEMDSEIFNELVDGLPPVVDGYIRPCNAPGLGLQLREGALARHPPEHHVAFR